MTSYQLSGRAAAAFEAIAEYTNRTFGIDQARHYWDDLKACFDSLAVNPSKGRRAEQLVRGLRRFELGAHIFSCMPTEKGVKIIRLLHYRMNARRHL
ncbi:MAG: type II toxin-antitoxin system RelE/ParE family toxin [Pseudomonadota bacterium]